MSKEILDLPNPKTDIKWNVYLATVYAEGVLEGQHAKTNEIVEAWAIVTKYKLYEHLQGFYGRTVKHLLDIKILEEDGTINWDKIDTVGWN